MPAFRHRLLSIPQGRLCFLPGVVHECVDDGAADDRSKEVWCVLQGAEEISEKT